ncbi:MAG: helix-turn-helix domain-containing protein [Patescibacteria group bacterium]|nr:helix-turn-helix domain-containing protein [Patescibacteria group bacterium]
METKSPQEVAVMLGVDEVTIRRLRHRAGLPERRRGQGYTLDEVERLRQQQRYKVHGDANNSPELHANNAPLTDELHAEMTAKMHASADDIPLSDPLPADIREQLAAIARQNDRLENLMRAMHARLSELTASGAELYVESTPLAPVGRVQRIKGPVRGQGVPPDLPEGTVTFLEFCRQTSVNDGSMKSRLNKSMNEKIRLETTRRAGPDGRDRHYLTPVQQRKALLQWHLYGPEHAQHPLCPEPHAQEGAQ